MANRISTTFKTIDWLLIREHLRDKGVIDGNWKSAIKLIHDRVTDRYLKPLQNLIDNEKFYVGEPNKSIPGVRKVKMCMFTSIIP